MLNRVCSLGFIKLLDKVLAEDRNAIQRALNKQEVKEFWGRRGSYSTPFGHLLSM